MWGTLLNAITVLIGSTLGLVIGGRLSPRIQDSVMTGLGLVTAYVGFSNAGATGNLIIPLVALISGVIMGELLALDARLEGFAGWVHAHFERRDTGGSPGEGSTRRARFTQGFITASLVFCVGPLTFVGSIQDGMGLTIGFEQLALKSVLDLFASIAFASSLGIGVLFSVLTVLSVQGGLALLGSLAGEFMSDAMVNEMTAVGGLILIGLALVQLDLKKPRMANFLPGLIIAPVIVAAGQALGIDLYPF